MQDLQIARYGIEQRRESSVLHHLQLMRVQEICHGDQDWLFRASGKEEEAADLKERLCCCWIKLYDALYGPICEYTRRSCPMIA